MDILVYVTDPSYVLIYFLTLLYVMKIISAQLTEGYFVLIRNHNREVPLRNWCLREADAVPAAAI